VKFKNKFIVNLLLRIQGWKPIDTAPKDKLIFLLEDMGEYGFKAWHGRWIDIPNMNKMFEDASKIKISPSWIAYYTSIRSTSSPTVSGYSEFYEGYPLVVNPIMWKGMPLPKLVETEYE